MIGVELRVVDKQLFGLLFPGQEPLRQWGTIIGQKGIRRDHCRAAPFDVVPNQFLHPIPRCNPAAENHIPILTHG
jgi:hypothetical protein